MRTLTRFAYNILASLGGISPLLTIGNELPGQPATSPETGQLDPQQLWYPLSKDDFDFCEEEREEIEREKENGNWENVFNSLFALIINESIQGYRRVILLINLAVASHILTEADPSAEEYNWVQPAIDEAEEVVREAPITIPQITDRISNLRSTIGQTGKN